MTFLFAPHINKIKIITYTDDILIQADTKIQLFDRLRDFHETLRKSKLKAVPDKISFFHAAVQILGHVNTENKIRPL